MRRPRLPIVIVLGFMWSGKLTLLRTYACIVNERGTVHVEQETIAVPHSDVLGRCLRCMLGGQLYPLIEQMCAIHAPDIVFIDCSGFSIPWEPAGQQAGTVRLKHIVSVHDHRIALDVFCIDDIPMLHEPAFDAWATALTVYRAKGIVSLGGDWFEWQYARRVHRRVRIVPQAHVQAFIGYIGEYVDRQHITEALYGAVAV